MEQNQREMFSKGLIEIANLGLAALVFVQLVSRESVNIGLIVLGVAFWVIFYIGAFSMSLDRNKNR
jgi:hypothetical protein